MKEIIQKNKKLIYVLFIFLFGLISFRFGIEVGFRKANFSNNWGNNYYKRIFGEPKKPRGFEPFMKKIGGIREDFFTNSGSVVGDVVSVSEKEIVVLGRDSVEKQVVLNEKTKIMKAREQILLKDIITGESVIVFGKSGESGEIMANLIRIVPKDLKPYQ